MCGNDLCAVGKGQTYFVKQAHTTANGKGLGVQLVSGDKFLRGRPRANTRPDFRTSVRESIQLSTRRDRPCACTRPLGTAVGLDDGVARQDSGNVECVAAGQG